MVKSSRKLNDQFCFETIISYEIRKRRRRNSTREQKADSTKKEEIREKKENCEHIHTQIMFVFFHFERDLICACKI
jgi:hypothetical protein